MAKLIARKNIHFEVCVLFTEYMIVINTCTSVRYILDRGKDRILKPGFKFRLRKKCRIYTFVDPIHIEITIQCVHTADDDLIAYLVWLI